MMRRGARRSSCCSSPCRQSPIRLCPEHAAADQLTDDGADIHAARAPGEHRDERGQERSAGDASDCAGDRVAGGSQVHVLRRRADHIAADCAGDQLDDEVDDRPEIVSCLPGSAAAKVRRPIRSPSIKPSRVSTGVDLIIRVYVLLAKRRRTSSIRRPSRRRRSGVCGHRC